MKHRHIILFISSLALAISGGIFSSTSAHAAELPSLVNTAIAKEESVRHTQDATPELTIEQRKDILAEIITASQSEVKNLQEKLTILDLDEDWSLARKQFLTRLATSSAYYSSLEDRLTRETVTLDEVKSIAKELRDWRETVYTPELKVAGNMLLIYQTDDVRRIVQARNEKIANDIKKLDRQKLVNTDTLKKYLGQADKSIKNAAVLNTKAKELYFIETIEPLQSRTLHQEALTEVITPTDAVIAEEPIDTQDQVRELSKEALKELKSAYELFFKMNDRIRK
ncbi:MAG: hypothetical protein UY31_C0038G0008 [Candidatus Wolfebacteria bacterium GW2011_GWE1_48_7]|nr:MAG: hypothetical protein UX49_C0012G0004 [Candidatus Wolfebacteria bacterium GW2011_GWC2_46_275]KKU41479.1 MAG: hypothetical protein UX58_C0008G0045 [Candidatus Wolfebacteria bacterium GW2011_GWB2_46_69]KKU53581.1 MAG: hypothetical protein UX76_C0013G0009 [Candidatus Wolfebacteria bacterium GW2011_GWC1_47_103]KKU58812.1 MAG: hypothetical protein UX83_C0011G0024 [Candidatus Wolfebacteria bacterium GW2011_GWE2_47_12]KKU65445.1 MAG: hypothetical protein UX90_C0005G0009 [Candidatus Wolfebacteri